MKEIYILRHAKSSWSNKNLSDFERPLAKRGIRDAKKVGNYGKINQIKISKVLCSKARRAKETFDIVADDFSFKIDDAAYTDDLYYGKYNQILSFLKKINDKYMNILIIGHNPMLHILIESLTDKDIAKFSTCNLAIISHSDKWNMIDNGKCSLESIIRPKEI
tara:strand:+ start:425 stop:913 length:489 start_codon:yes stop_codon:yes gene_type:complete